MYSPRKPPAPKVPAGVKDEVQRKADELIALVLKPRAVKPRPLDYPFNYIMNIYTSWYRHYFYFCATYCCPVPNAIAPSFESKFARMEYVGGNRFNLSFMRYTHEWIEIYRGITLDECLASIRDDSFFLVE